MTYRARNSARLATKKQVRTISGLLQKFYDMTSAFLLLQPEPQFSVYSAYRLEFPHVSLNTRHGLRHLRNWAFHRARERNFQFFHSKSFRRTI